MAKLKQGWYQNKRGDDIHYVNGMIHREDGPAIFYIWGDVGWWWEGGPLSFDIFVEIANISDEHKTQLILQYG